MPVRMTKASAVTAAIVDGNAVCSTSAAQIARTRWKNGSHRKLQRNRPEVGVMQSKSTIKSRITSHLIRLTISRGRQINVATSAEAATKPHANSAAECGRLREEKSVQFTVHDGRINPGSAAGGTRHCQCAADDCSSRAEPCIRSRSASHAGADNPNPNATPESIGKTANAGGILVSRRPRLFPTFRDDIVLIESHPIRSSSIKTV